MNENQFHIGFISSIEQFLEVASYVSEGKNLIVSFSKGGLDDSISAGLDMEKKGAEVIITRRATANILRENLNIPVLAIGVTAFDLLHSLKTACRQGTKILLTSLKEEMPQMDISQNFLGVDIVTGEFFDQESLRKCVYKGKQNGCDFVIGGGTSVKIAREIGLDGIEFHTTENVMNTAIEDAISIAGSKRQEQEKATRLRTIMDATSEGIISIDQNGLITTINQSVADLFKIDEQAVLGSPIQNYISGNSAYKVLNNHKAIWNEVKKINGKSFIVNQAPLKINNNLIGAVITLTETSSVISAENKLRRSLAKRPKAKYTFKDLIFRSPEMEKTISEAKQYAQTDSSILISGESGTGKELLAHAIHNASSRKNSSFVSINCGALPDQLLESELFGHEEGAFTGSKKGGHLGLFELAHNGSIFLDEIGNTPPRLQNQLLRVLQEKEVMRVGGDRLIPVNVRVVSATNQPLNKQIQMGHFREDLLFRLNILTINIPPLRNRTQDIPALTEAMVQKLSSRYEIDSIAIPSHYIDRLKSLNWPGNVRQLHNFLEKLVVLCNGKFSRLIFEELHAELLEYSQLKEKNLKTENFLHKSFQNELKNSETEIILKTLEECHYSKTKAAKKLGISRTTLWRKMKNLQ